MPDYNPNAIWGSKKKEYHYTPPGDQTSYTAASNAPLGNAGNDGTGTGGAQKPPSFFKRHGLVLFTIGIFLVIAIAVVIYYLLLPPQTPNIAISFLDPSATMIGQPFPVVVTVSNNSHSVIEDAMLNITLPDGLSFASSTTATQAIGTVSSGTINPPQTLWFVVTSSTIAGTSQTVNATLAYHAAITPKTTFVSSASTSFAIGTQSALSLSYNAPSSIFSGEDFDITVHYQNNTASALQGIQFSMPHPPAFHFVSSSSVMPMDTGDTTWKLGTLAANATGTLVITGNIVGPANAQYPLTGTIGATFSGQTYPAASAPIAFTVTPAPLSLSLSLNNSSTYVSKAGDSLNYTLTYANNSGVTFKSVNISAALSGAMYDFSSLQTNGSFNSKSDTITWHAADEPALAALAPGQSGTLIFSIGTKSAFPIKLLSDKNYSLHVTATATSPTVPPNTAGTNTTSVTTLNTKVGGLITLSANGYYKEASSSIANAGPYPPTVNQPTQYTIHWTITNYATDATSVTVSAYLQSGTTFTGVAKSTGLASTPLPVYNAGTGEVSWTIPLIPATTGVISPPVSAIFQVSNTPAINQVGNPVTLMGPTTLTATDAYTGATMQATVGPITTQLPHDPSVGGQTGDVVQ